MLLVVVEADAGIVAGGSLEALTLGRGLAAGSEVPLHAVTFGASHDVAAELGKYGVSVLHAMAGQGFEDYSPEIRGAALRELIESTGATGVLATVTDRANEVMAHAAARMGQAFASNCVAISSGDPWRLTRLWGGGTLLEDAELSGTVKFATLAKGAVDADHATTAAEITVDEFTPQSACDVAHSAIVDRTTRGAGVTLASARVVIAGGRGLGSAEGFASLEELAGLLGGAVGCSRVATNNGWRSHSDQVGLTGTKISPDLYIACGISGATQHWAGCMGAKSILAINTDPEAPLVARADYAVIGDVHQVLPAVLERVRARKQLPGAA